MSPNLLPAGVVRSAAVVNEDIRTLLIRAGGWLSAADRVVYERLRDEWAEADRADVVEAA